MDSTDTIGIYYSVSLKTSRGKGAQSQASRKLPSSFNRAALYGVWWIFEELGSS